MELILYIIGCLLFFAVEKHFFDVKKEDIKKESKKLQRDKQA